MPIQSRVQLEKAPTSWGTGGLTGAVTYQVVKQIDRTRSWSNSTYRTARQRAERVMSHGYLPTTAYSDNLQHVVNSKLLTISGRRNWYPSGAFVWRLIPSVPRIPVSVTSNDASLLLAQTLDSLQSKISGVGTSVPLTILEAGKTADMIGEAAGRLYRSYRHLRHGNFLAAAKSLNLDRTPRRVSRRNTLEQNWLEYRYGWRLVVYDITSYMKQIHNMLTTKPIVHRVTVFKQTGSRNSYTNGGQVLLLPISEGSIVYDRNRVDTLDITATAGYVYALESVALSTGQELGMLNPASVAWDFLPGSFMLDWASNVSSVLEGLTAFQGKKFLDGWTCVTVHSKRTEYWTNIRPGPYVVALDPCAFYAGPVEERRFQRSVLSSFQPASLRLDLSASFQNGLDGLALIKQVFGPRRK